MSIDTVARVTASLKTRGPADKSFRWLFRQGLLSPIYCWRIVLICVSILVCRSGPINGEDNPRFVRGINFNGPPVTIDGRLWDGENGELKLARFENQEVPLIPETDADRSRMLRSSVWSSDGRNKVAIDGLPDGKLTLFLYVWEDNNSETYSVRLQGKVEIDRFQSGSAGEWKRLGPWHCKSTSGSILLESEGGHSNWSGVEIWMGHLAKHPSAPTLKPETPPTVEQIFFDEKVAPILARNCLDCHNRNLQEGELDVSNQASMVAQLTGENFSETAIGDAIESHRMPKDRPPLASSDMDILRDWFRAGKAWGRKPIEPIYETNEHRAGYDWWAFQPLSSPPIPQVKSASWPHNEIDHFVLKSLEDSSLAPAPTADPRILIRRISYDLTGLPPDPELVEKYLAAPNEATYREIVQSLLASPAFGEQWGRHWLDVIRFGETQGFERNFIRPNAWRFRDWVIDAYNADMPYDRFVRLQIAGDVLEPDSLPALIATGYHVCGTWDQVGHLEGSVSMQRVAREEHVEDLVGTLGQSFLGLSLQCARCHDHKFDPISQKEYYQIASVFAGVHQEKEERGGIELTPENPHFDFFGAAHVIKPRQPTITRVLARGNVSQPGEIVSPAGLQAFSQLNGDWNLSPESPDGERRKALALWLTDSQNSLFARVYVNRIWAHLFGIGIVDTPSDFGFQGGRPSHPELLDYLAQRFVASGYQTKPLIEMIVNSATYRQSSTVANEKGQSIDKQARLRWRGSIRRLSGEEVRDSMLFVSGALNTEMGGISFRDILVKEGTNHEFTTPINIFAPFFNRRTIYRLWARSGNEPLLASFDCPEPSVSTPRRAQTITPIQALALLNSPLSESCSEAFAQRVQAAHRNDVSAQIQEMVRLAYQRPLKPNELELLQKFADEQGLEQLALVLFNSNEFLFVK